MGASEQTLAKLRGARENDDDTLEVEPENADAVRLFLGLQTQWRFSTLSNGKFNLLVRTGLDYGVLPVVCTALCITPGEALLGQLQLLEGETLRLLAEHRAKLFA